MHDSSMKFCFVLFFKKKKLSLFAGSLLLYTENPKDSTKRVLELINKYINLQDTKLVCKNQLKFIH